MAIEEIHPQTFSDPESLGWTDSAKTHNNNLADYGYVNVEITEDQGILAVWSAFEGKGEWEDDGDIKQKITSIDLSAVDIGLRYSDLDDPNWWHPEQGHWLKAMSNENVSEQTYSADVPEGFDWTKAKMAALYSKDGPPETITLRIFDSWGEEPPPAGQVPYSLLLGAAG